MADLKELMAKVTVDEVTKQFAGHFRTKSSVKNLLRKIGNAKLLEPIVESEEVGPCGFSDDATRDTIMTAIIAGFDAYVAQKDAWDKAGDKHPLPERVEFFRDAVIAELDKTDEIRALVDKGIEAIKTGASVVSDYLNAHEETEDIRKAILASVIRTVMIAATAEPKEESASAKDVKTGESVDAEIIPPGSAAAGHTAEENPKKPDAAGDGAGKKQEIEKVVTSAEKLMEEVRGLLSKDLSDNVNAERVRDGILNSAKAVMNDNTNGFTVSDPASGNIAEWGASILRSLLPVHHSAKVGVIAVDDAIALGATVIVNGINASCGDVELCDADPERVSVSVATGAFMMYSLLAAELPECENVDTAIMTILDEEMQNYLKNHDNVAPKAMWATYVNLIGIRNLDKYREAVNAAIVSTERVAEPAVAALARFGHALETKSAERHLAKGIEQYMMLVA